MTFCGVPDHFNDDQSIYYVDQLANMLEGGELLYITNDHIQAIIAEAHYMADTLTIHQKLSHIQRALKVPKKHYNDYSKYYYRTNDDTYESVKPLTHQFDCVLTLPVEPIAVGQRIYMQAIATLSDDKSSISSPGWAREPDNQKGMSDSQLSGSTASFARKYALEGLLLLDNSTDLDSLDNTTAAPDPEVNMIINMIGLNDVTGIHEAWSGLIAKHWPNLSDDIRDDLNRIIKGGNDENPS